MRGCQIERCRRAQAGASVRLKLYREKWYAVWLDGGATKRASLRTADRAVAERNLAAFIAANDAPRETVADIMTAYLADRTGRPSHSRSLDPMSDAGNTKKICKQELIEYCGSIRFADSA